MHMSNWKSSRLHRGMEFERLPESMYVGRFRKGSVSLADRNVRKNLGKLKHLPGALFGRIPLNIGTFIFGALFVYMLISILLYLTADHITVYQVTAGPLSRNQTYTALALREEQVVTSAGSGYITYYARDNSKVAKSGVVYTLGTQQQEAAVAQLDEEDYADLRLAMANFSSYYSDNNFYDTYNFKYELEGSILQYTGIQADEEGNVPQSVNGSTVYTSDQAGVILYSTDGYEDVTEDNLSADLFDRRSYRKESLAASRQVKAGDKVYKLITSEEWSILIPLTAEQTVQLSGRNTIKVNFLKDNTVQTGKFTFITDADGNYYAKISFTSGMIRYAQERFLDVELVTNTQTGLKVPLSAIVTKDFYVIPKEYVTYREEDGTAGFNKVIESGDGEDTTADFVEAVIYDEDDENYYVDRSTFQEGDVIIKPDSQDTYTVEATSPLEGVYSVNRGYAVFRQVVIIDQNDEYCIVEAGTSYGIAQYDHIVRDGSTVKEDDILVS